MHTPFDQFKNKNKISKQRINLTLSPVRHSFSIEVTPRVHTTSTKSQWINTLPSKKKMKNAKSEGEKINNKMNKQTEDNYQIIVKNALKNSQNVRFILSKSAQPTNECRPVTGVRTNPKRNFQIQGTHCGRDLIKLNRRKLEELISKVEGNPSQHLVNQPIPEIIIQKCKMIRLSMHERQKKSSRMGELQKKQKIKNSIKVMRSKQCFSPKQQDQIGFIDSLYPQSEKFDTRQFLKCSQINTKESQNNLSNTSFSLVLNSSEIVNFIRESKKKKGALKIPKVHEQIGSSAQETIPIINSKEVFIRKTSARRSFGMKSHSHSGGKERSSSQTNSRKAIINGINFDAVRGWESAEEVMEVNLTNPSYFY